MSSTTDKRPDSEREQPAALEQLLAPLRDAIVSMGRAQQEGVVALESALEQMVRSIEQTIVNHIDNLQAAPPGEGSTPEADGPAPIATADPPASSEAIEARDSRALEEDVETSPSEEIGAALQSLSPQEEEPPAQDEPPPNAPAEPPATAEPPVGTTVALKNPMRVMPPRPLPPSARIHPPGSALSAAGPPIQSWAPPDMQEGRRLRKLSQLGEAAATAPEPVAESPAPDPKPGKAPEPSVDSTETKAEPSPRQPEPVTPSPEKAPTAPDSDRAQELQVESAQQLRRTLLGLQNTLGEIDRIAEAEDVIEKVWNDAKARGLRVLLLQDKGRRLYAEGASGFSNFEGEKAQRLRKVVVPMESDGIFAATSAEKTVYSGPRPVRGFPVDLALVLGKRAPAWCLIIPFPYRNRWGRYLYIEADGSHLDEIFLLDPVARYAVKQLRVSQYNRNEPADRVRAIKEMTLQARKRKRALIQAQAEKEQKGQKHRVQEEEELSANSVDVETQLAAFKPDDDLFSADGDLIQPMDADQILEKVGDLPAMPHVATRVLGMLNNPDASVHELQEVIVTDQALAGKLLQIANSSFYGSSRDCDTISEAVVRLGFSAIKSWLLATATRSIFVQNRPTQDLRMLWSQSVLTAMAAQLVAETTEVMDPEVAFMGGLMQNVGLLMLARNHEAVFGEIHIRSLEEQIPYHETERRMLGFDHADLGALLLNSWNLGPGLVGAVASHHRLESAGREEEFALVISMAERFALRMGGGPTAEKEEDLANTHEAHSLGLDQEKLDELATRLAHLMRDRSLLA